MMRLSIIGQKIKQINNYSKTLLVCYFSILNEWMMEVEEFKVSTQ